MNDEITLDVLQTVITDKCKMAGVQAPKMEQRGNVLRIASGFLVLVNEDDFTLEIVEGCTIHGAYSLGHNWTWNAGAVQDCAEGVVATLVSYRLRRLRTPQGREAIEHLLRTAVFADVD